MQDTGREKKLLRVINAVAASDGDGVRIRRIAGREINVLLDPFLLLDEIKSDSAADYIGGFPPHPHRGFETITYMLAGKFRHRDHLGNEGVVGPGGAQWMTAGRGVIHSEMPEQQDGLLHGFQLWVNLPASEKMKPAAYRDVAAEEAAYTKIGNGGEITLLAGGLLVSAGAQSAQLSGPIQTVTQAVIADIRLPASQPLALHFASDCRALVYVISGRTGAIDERQMGVYGEGEQLRFDAGAVPTRLLLLAGQPLREPIAQHGPFVMNTREEIERAIADYQANRLV